MPNRQIVFCVDSRSTSGGGHVSRSLSLARSFKVLHFNVAFAVEEFSPAIEAAGFPQNAAKDIFDAQKLRDAWPSADLLIIDHYKLNNIFESGCRGWAKEIAVVDDHSTRLHDCDFYVDSGAETATIPPGATALLGPAFAGVNSELLRIRRESPKPMSSIPKILINFGQTGAKTPIELALRGLSVAEVSADISLILGADAVELKVWAEKLVGELNLKVKIFGRVGDMPQRMADADIAIGATGVSSWERCVLGLPSIGIICFENQLSVAKLLGSRGAMLIAGRLDEINSSILAEKIKKIFLPGIREELTRKSQLLCDGYGSRRLALALAGPQDADGNTVWLRPAVLEDAKTVLEWQNDEQTRKYSRNPQVPTWDEHLAWYQRKIGDPKSIFSIIRSGKDDVGVLRLDRDGSEFLVSIFLKPNQKSRGIGRAALRAGQFLVRGATLIAEIHNENTASIKAFEAAGFTRAGTADDSKDFLLFEAQNVKD